LTAAHRAREAKKGIIRIDSPLNLEEETLNALTHLKCFLGLAPKASAYIVIRGRNYEGGYHHFAERIARLSNMPGWIRVVPNSYVEIEVCGQTPRIEQLLENLRNGPGEASLRSFEISWRPFHTRFKNFQNRP
jgi:acylphosphatase